MALRKHTQRLEITADQGLLLGAAPALDLPLRGDCVRDAVEILTEDEDDGPAGLGPSVMEAGIMLGDAVLQGGTGRADLIGVIAASQNIDVSAHGRDRATDLALRPSTSSG